MNKIKLFIILCCYGSLSYGQSITDTSIALISYLKQGDVLKYETTYKETTTKKGKKVEKESTYLISLHVDLATDSSYDMSMKYSDFNFSYKMSQDERHLSELFTDLEIKYRTDEYGMIDSIVNWREIKDIATKSYDVFLADNKKIKKLPDSLQLKMKDVFTQQFSTREQIELFLMKEINIIHYLNGFMFYRNQPNTYEKYYFNPFMVEDFEGTETFLVAEVDEKEESCEIEINAELPEEKAKELIANYFSTIAKELGNEASIPEEEIPSISIKEKASYKLDLKRGIVNRVSWTKTSKSKGTSKKEYFKFKQVN